uniref:Serpin domain-containing protein n=1 Tax=Timema shepardi TaxID=629360 RepID=A0A7R9FWE2_TIMSH|nr:unnamed protein product [Timema shepardi]
MDLGNGTKAYYADPMGRPVPKPTASAYVGSPPDLLHPDRYEFYTFDDSGDLVKKLMTLDEIHSIIAAGESGESPELRPNYYHSSLKSPSLLGEGATVEIMDDAVAEYSSPEMGVHQVIESVQNVLKGELEASKDKSPIQMDSMVKPGNESPEWSALIPGIHMSPDGSTIIEMVSKVSTKTSTDIPSMNIESLKLSPLGITGRPIQDPSQGSLLDLYPTPQENTGLEASTLHLDKDVRDFSDLCNELAFRLWSAIASKGPASARSLVVSPFAVTSLLAMVFLGARGPTSGQMNDILRLDDMVTFNPHQVFRNVTESIVLAKNPGVVTAAFVRELYSDKRLIWYLQAKGKLLDFYKERAQQFYDGHVEEVDFSNIGDVVRRRTNLLVKRQTFGKVPEYLRGSNLILRPPLAVFSANIFQTDCSQASTEGRDGEMYFTLLPATRQRRLVPIPAVVWRDGFLAGYDPVLDATAISLGGADTTVSTVMVLPGQQGQLASLEERLVDSPYAEGAWSRLLRTLHPRSGLELQLPRFSHRSQGRADLKGLNGLSNDLHLADMVQVNTFSTCSEESRDSRRHVEVFPAATQRVGREEDDGELEGNEQDVVSIPLALRPRQARVPEGPRLRFDRPFLYLVRHNPTGLILHMGRFNPRLLR